MEWQMQVCSDPKQAAYQHQSVLCGHITGESSVAGMYTKLPEHVTYQQQLVLCGQWRVRCRYVLYCQPIYNTFHGWKLCTWANSNYGQWIYNFCHLIIAQFHNPTSNVNMWTLAWKISANLQTLQYGHNDHHGLIIVSEGGGPLNYRSCVSVHLSFFLPSV